MTRIDERQHSLEISMDYLARAWPELASSL